MTSARQKTIRIAGGGISGMTTAIALTLRGFNVEIHEKRQAAGGRFKGDLQGLENWTQEHDVIEEIQGMELGVQFDYAPLPPLFLLINGKSVYPIAAGNPLCYLVKRGTAPDTLDQALYHRVKELGIPVTFGNSLSPDEADIIATGPNSRKIFAVDLGVKFQTRHEDVAVALVARNAAYDGYAYLLITNGYGCLCTVLFNRFSRLREQFALAREMILRHFPVDMENVTEVGGVGSFATNDFYRQSKIHVGEAGGLQDFLFGFGILSAIRSGVLAAECWETGKDYAEEAQRRFSGYQKAGTVNRFLYEKIGNLYGGYRWLSRWLNQEDNRHYFLNKAYHYTPIHHVIYPWARRSMRNRYSGLF